MRRRWRTVGLLLLVPGLVLGSARGAGAIAHGTWVSKPSITAPWVLPLEHSIDTVAPWAIACTATALDAETVVTSAACVQTPGFYRLVVSGMPLYPGPTEGVAAIISHPKFRTISLVNNIAVLRPQHPLTLASYAHLATSEVSALLTANKVPALTLFGWGRRDRDISDGHLRQGVVQLQPKAARRAYPARYRPDTMLAAGHALSHARGYVRACAGDEGGPLVLRRHGVPYVVGVVSWSAKVCTEHAPTLLTSVAPVSTWLRHAAAALPQAARDHNRAAPEAITAPTVEGAITLGSVLTCHPGTWPANATSVSVRWDRNGGSGVGHLAIAGPTWTLSSDDGGSAVTCSVDVRTPYGVAVSRIVLSVPGLPRRGYPSDPRMSVPSGAPVSPTPGPTALPTPGSTATCTAPPYQEPGVVVTTTWSAVTNGVPAEVGRGQVLALTPEVLRQVAGRTIRCMTDATIGGFSHDFAIVDRMMAPLVPPKVLALFVAPDLTSTTPVVGTTMHAEATATGGPETISYTWAMQATDPAVNPPGDTTLDPSARILGTGPTYVLATADVAAFSTEYLVCKVTASSWQGSDSRWDWF